MNKFVGDISRRCLIQGGVASALTLSALPRQALAQCPPGFLSPVNQSILTVNQRFKIEAFAYSAPNFYFDGTPIGQGVISDSSGAYSLYYTPGSTNFSVNLTAQAASGPAVTVKLAVAEDNRFKTDLTLWAATNLRVTAGESDPDGGAGAYKATALVSSTAVKHIISTSAVRASVNLSSGFEVWVEYNPSFPVILIYPTNTNVAQYCYVNLQNGDTNGNYAYAKVVETRGNWVRIWFYRSQGSKTDTVNIYACKQMNAPLCVTDGTEYIRFYKPRSADGLLPFTNFQQMQRKSNGNINGRRQWLTRSPFNDNEANLNRDLPINVVVPDSYNPDFKYPVIYVLDVENTPGTSYLDGLQVLKNLNIHNIYNVILAQTFWQGGYAPWYGTKSDGTIRADVHVRDCLVGLVDEQFSTIASPEGRILLGFSKSGWGAMSLLLRNPTVFGYAGSWDAPFNLQFGGTNFGQAAYYGTEAQYKLYNPKDILGSYVGSIKTRKRIVLGGGVVFNTDTNDFANLLTSFGVPYSYIFRDLSKYGGLAHNWNAYDNDFSGNAPNGWCTTFVSALMSLVAAPKG